MKKKVIGAAIAAFGIIGAAAVMDASSATPQPQPAEGIFAQSWNSSTVKNAPKLQTQYLTDNIVVMRQSLQSSYEAPFLYLIMGQDGALLIDTGASDIGLREAVDDLLVQWQAKHGVSNIALTVMHTHSHSDHTAGDSAFEKRPNTKIVGHSVDEVKAFFDLANWPQGQASMDLGGQRVAIFPAPGHHDSHVMIHPEGTPYLLTGDSLYPGRLFFRCDRLPELKGTIDRAVDYGQKNDIAWLLGTHIELGADLGVAYTQDDRTRAREHRLELPASTLSDVSVALAAMQDAPVVKAFDHFILFPYPANPEGKSPPNWCQS